MIDGIDILVIIAGTMTYQFYILIKLIYDFSLLKLLTKIKLSFIIAKVSNSVKIRN